MDNCVINQAHGNNWSFYNGDCVVVMNGLPKNIIDFDVHSPPFLSLFIYSDSIADLGNNETEAQFFEGYRFAIREMHRVHKPGKCIAVHCKDTMRYMSSHGYAGLYDFPGEIIRAYEAEGFLFQRWITIWKDPVVEMQRTKTYGLLHKSFCERAEVTRQGCADFVLIFQKPMHGPESVTLTDEKLPGFNPGVFERIRHLWSNEGDEVGFNQVARHLSVWSKPLSHYTSHFIDRLSEQTEPGRLCVVHCKPLPVIGSRGSVARFDMMGEVIQRFERQGNWKFHSRCALTDGSYLVTFRNWRGEIESGKVKHNLKSPIVSRYQYQNNDGSMFWFDASRVSHPDYIGTEPPVNWHDDSYYSILTWQKYASPVWFDLSGLPKAHNDAWMDIDQTDVLNARLVRKDEEGEKHICPLQLGLISRLIGEYTRPGDVVHSPYGGIGSEGYTAVRMGRKAILSELKPTYWQYSVKLVKELELELTQVDLFSLAGLQL